MGGSLDARGRVVSAACLECAASAVALQLEYFERAKAEAERLLDATTDALDALDEQSQRAPRHLDEVLYRTAEYCRLETQLGDVAARLCEILDRIDALTAEHASIRARIALLEHDVEAWLDWAAKTPMGEAYAVA